MTKHIHFVVYYDPEDKKFWLDDETLMANFGGLAWWDDEAEEWTRPQDEEEEALDHHINDQLASIVQPTPVTAYFAKDGSFGVAEGIELVNTHDWTEEDWTMIEMTSDEKRPEVARAISDAKRDGEY
jgi:hypothetical protein